MSTPEIPILDNKEDPLLFSSSVPTRNLSKRKIITGNAKEIKIL